MLFISGISIWFLFRVSIFLLNSSFIFWIIFLISLRCLFKFSLNSPSYLLVFSLHSLCIVYMCTL
jgi:hypothetical protein